MDLYTQKGKHKSNEKSVLMKEDKTNWEHVLQIISLSNTKHFDGETIKINEDKQKKKTSIIISIILSQ